MTATSSGPPILAERADIHKSCKAIESLLNVLDDYDQVVSAMATLEKRLAKALRELAGLKVTNEIAANAFNVSANVFEALADISGKFAKITDKEFNGIGAEVRRWFKKLAKEEKAHDERLSSVNTRIKQAGQAYEKKSRKNTRDAVEEHARYINLVSTLGPEISKDKYEHGLTVTRQQMLTTYGVAACLARIADAEWLRICESTRRFSPNIGPLGEWRALCEGGWDRPLPPDIGSAETDRNLGEYIPSGRPAIRGGNRDEVNGGLVPRPAEPVNKLANLPMQSQTTSGSNARSDKVYISSSPQSGSSNDLTVYSLQPPRPLTDPNTGSVRSLSAFPTPPGHFPIPPPRSVSFQSDTSGTNSNVSSSLIEREDLSRADTPTQDVPATPGTSDAGGGSQRSTEGIRDAVTSESTKATELGGTSVNTPTSSGFVAAMRHQYTNSLGTNSAQPKDIPRLPTSVADLATRYQSPEPHGSPPRPRRPSLLIRRQNNDVSVVRADEPQYHDNVTPPEQPQNSDTREKERRLLERERELELRAREIEREREELVKVRQDMQTSGPPEPSEHSAFAQQLLLRARERRLSLRRQQQREESDSPLLSKPANLTESPISSAYHTAYTSSHPGLASPTSSSDAQQGHHAIYSRHSQQSLTQNTNIPSLGKPISHSHNSQSLDLSSNRGTPHPKPRARDPHPPYCACERCSIKYSESSGLPTDVHALRPPEQPIVLRPDNSSSSGNGGGLFSIKRSGAGQQATEKSKGGWMRRLSMPVVMGHALNLDPSSSKKNNAQRESSSSSSLYALGAGIGNTPLPNPSAKGGRFLLDGRKNVSSTALRPGGNTGITIQEDGKIAGRSYEANMLANRSMTNLVQSGKR